jgi:2-methylcitrate dehydratase PrpD
VRCHPIVAQDNADPDPRTMLAARLSLPYNVALVIVHGDVLAADLADSELHNPRIRSLLPRIKLIADPNMKRRGAHLLLRFNSGGREEETIEVPRGSASSPLTWEDIVAKFKPLVQSVIGEAHQQKIIDAVANVEKLDGAALMQVLRDAVAEGQS